MNGQPSTVLQIGHPTVRKPAISDAPSLHLVHPSRSSTPHSRPSTGRVRPVVAGAGSSSATFKLVDSLSVDSIKGHSQVQVRVQRGADRRGARRMREGHMDASGFLYASADGSLVVVREMPPRRGARRGGRGGRGRGAERVQPEVQPVAQATDPAAPVTHTNLVAMEQRFRDLIMQMRE
ncbi:gag protease polyprotein [Cucumis melo var. makuwa]|uniref:Gag protease polyprotein n=1 Tax=Cucumis melo var. makuwa TaxID=1194695 RepID=A0A5D3BA26_CUCMM|nr:gag protease polyprotein [Cucumis melo var. makuwa]